MSEKWKCSKCGEIVHGDFTEHAVECIKGDRRFGPRPEKAIEVVIQFSDNRGLFVTTLFAKQIIHLLTNNKVLGEKGHIHSIVDIKDYSTFFVKLHHGFPCLERQKAECIDEHDLGLDGIEL